HAPPRAARPTIGGQPRAAPRTPTSVAGMADPAGIVRRGLAAVIDVALLGLVDFVVVYFTIKICRLSMSEVAMVPTAPLLAFLLLQNGGYFIAFTTTGQTLGKMMAGVRVLADDSDSAPDMG